MNHTTDHFVSYCEAVYHRLLCFIQYGSVLSLARGFFTVLDLLLGTGVIPNVASFLLVPLSIITSHKVCGDFGTLKVLAFRLLLICEFVLSPTSFLFLLLLRRLSWAIIALGDSLIRNVVTG